MRIAYFLQQKLFLLNPILFVQKNSQKFYWNVRLRFLKLFPNLFLQKKNKNVSSARESIQNLAQAHLTSKP